MAFKGAATHVGYMLGDERHFTLAQFPLRHGHRQPVLRGPSIHLFAFDFEKRELPIQVPPNAHFDARQAIAPVSVEQRCAPRYRNRCCRTAPRMCSGRQYRERLL